MPESGQSADKKGRCGMSDESISERILYGESADLAAIRDGRGEWFDELDDSITENWQELSDDAKAIAYLWGCREAWLESHRWDGD